MLPVGFDATGATEVSDELMNALYLFSVVSPHTAANPLTIMLQPGGTYWVDYTLRLKNVSQHGDTMWPDFPTFDLDNTTIDLNGATLDQRNYTLFPADPRTKNGDAILFTNGVSNVTVKNGTLTNSSFGAAHLRKDDYFNWQGIRIGGQPPSQHLNFTNLTIHKPGGDFAEITSLVDDVTIQNSILTNPGRQGIVFNEGSHLNFNLNDIHGGHITFDSEPAGGKTIEHVVIAGNTGDAGGSAYFQSNVGLNGTYNDFLIAFNTISGGNPAVQAHSNLDAPRSTFSFVANTATVCWGPFMGFAHPVETEGWYGVTVNQNSWKIKPGAVGNQNPNIVAPHGGPWPAPVTTPNTFSTSGC
jgi:hypothetical protein